MAHRKMDYRDFISYLKTYEAQLKNFNKEFVNLLAEKGLMVSRMEYQNAEYAGVNDVEVTSRQSGNGTFESATIKANGNAVLFIEFGTGITKEDSPEERNEINKPIAKHGEYGHGHGAWPNGWTYYGYVGDHPPVGTHIQSRGKKGTLVKTMGNNATPAMYDAKKAIKESYMEACKKAFGKV